MKIVPIKKEELIERASQRGFFKKNAVKVIYGRSNGQFYYNKPPTFADGHETFEITKEDVAGGSGEIEYPLNGKETIELIKSLENTEGVAGLIESGQLLADDARKGVIKALEALSNK